MAGVRIGLIIGIALVRLPTLFEPQWYSDEGIFTAIAWSMSNGTALYSGIFDNQAPGIFWIFQLLLALGAGSQHVIVQLAATVAVIAAALLTFEIARRVEASIGTAALAAALTGLAISLPTLDGDLFNVELAALPFLLGALLLAFSPRLLHLYAAGALLGFAVATRPSIALDSLAILVPLLSADRRAARVLALGAGSVMTAAVCLAALAAGGSLSAYLAVIMPADRAYLAWSNGGTFGPLLVRLGVLALIAAGWLRVARSPSWRLLAVWVPASVAGAGLTPRELTHYVHEAIPPLAIAIAILALRIRPRLLAAPAAGLALLAAIELTLILPAQQTALMNSSRPPAPLLHNFSFPQLPAYYLNWFEYVSGARSRSRYEAYFPGFREDQADADFLRLQSPHDHGLIVLGDRPWIYFKSGLLPAGHYLTTNTAFWRVPTAAADLERTLASGCAGIVVFKSGPGDWNPALAAGGYRSIAGAPSASFRSANDILCP